LPLIASDAVAALSDEEEEKRLIRPVPVSRNGEREQGLSNAARGMRS